MSVPLLDLNEQHRPLMGELREAFERVMGSSGFILGPTVEAFEANLARYCGAKHAVGVSSGTDALLAAMMALGVEPGDEVITTPFSFFATAGSIARLGAKPVFVDVDPVTFNMDVSQVSAAVTSRTVAIMPVHLFGLAADMAAINAVAQRHHLPVIEDAAQAIGARDRDQPIGTLGTMGALSFFPTKNLGGMGDSGAVLTNDDALAATLRKIRVHGADSTYHHTMIGANFRIDALQAAMLDVKLRHLDGWIEARRANAARYDERLSDAMLVKPTAPPHAFHTYNQYTIRVKDGRRDALMAHLAERGIGCRVYYPLPLHLQPCFASLGYQAGQFPVSEQLAAEVLSLPIYPELNVSQLDEVIAAVGEFSGQ